MAITTNENLISNLSYTEKDFQTIYPALLDLVKKETLKWDPSVSNESDPGVLLLKLNAIIADKCNYNIDKNILECFPLSVTQQANAKELFEQLGYFMHWYRAANTVVSLKYIGEVTTDENGNANNNIYTIPKFTMVTNEDSEIIYTLIDTKGIKTDGTLEQFNALQGIATRYEINGNALITTADLDSNNRLYFNETEVAENGIFITHAGGQEDYNSWIKKDNLLKEELNSKNYFYKFGVSQDLNTCYLEFPENAEELFQDGINIVYIKTIGEDGNIAMNFLNSFYNDLIVSDPITGENKTLTTDEITITNYVNGSDGVNPETIDEAYLGYKKVVGTFDTLVTLRDYMNALKNSDYVSNGVVSDRTTDIQSSYKIMSQVNTVNQIVNELEKSKLNYVEGYKRGNEFYETSEYVTVLDPDVKKNYIDKADNDRTYRVIYKNKQHEYIEADPVKEPAMGAFDLKLYILSATSLINTASQYRSSFELNTSDEVQAIISAEINNYKCIQHEIIDLLPNKICFIKNKYPIDCKIIPQYSLTDTQKSEVTKNVRNSLYNKLNSSKIEFGQELTFEEVYNIILNADSRIKAISLAPLDYTPYVVYLKKDEGNENSILTEVPIDKYKLTSEGVLDFTDSLNGAINNFRIEIYAKSVLAGKTQFFVKDTAFNYGINQKYQLLKNNVGRLTTGLTVELSSDNDWIYDLKENEVLQIFAPNLIEYESFSSNVKVEYCFNLIEGGTNRTVSANSTYKLAAEEYIIFYWLDSSSDAGYSYAVYGKGTIIRPSFTLGNSVVEPKDLIGNSLLKNVKEIVVNNQKYEYAKGHTLTEESDDITPKIKSLVTAHNILSGSKKIDILLKNSINIDSTSYSCYWVLNEQENGEYVLFNNSEEKSRLLKSGEYFIYIDTNSSDISILGSGTYITRQTVRKSDKISCKAIDYSEILSEGILALDGNWVTVSAMTSLEVTEMQYMSFGDGAIINIEPRDKTITKLVLSSENNTNLADCNIKYKNSLSDISWSVIPTIDLKDPDFTWQALTLFRLTLSVDKPQVLRKGQVIKYNVYDTNNDWLVELDPAYDYMPHTAYKVGDNLIYEKIEGVPKTYKVLADIPATQSSFAEIEFLLNEDPSIRTYATYWKKYYKTPEEWDLMAPGEIDPSKEPFENPTYILSSIMIDDVGPKISTITYNEDDKVVTNSIYAYVMDTARETGINFLEDGTTQIIFSKINIVDYEINKPYGKGTILLDTITKYKYKVVENITAAENESINKLLALGKIKINDDKVQEKSIRFRLPKGNYIMPITHTSENNILSELKLFLTRGSLLGVKDIGKLLFTLKPTINLPSSKETYNITFDIFDLDSDYIDDAFTTLVLNKNSIEYIREDSSKVTVYSNGAWIDKKYRYLRFSTEGDTKNEQLIQWLNQNCILTEITEELSSMSNPKETNFRVAGNYYARIDDLPDTFDDDISTDFFVTVKVLVKYKSDTSDPAIVSIPPIFKYFDSTIDSSNKDLNADLFVRIYNKIKELDYNNLFNYTYVVNEDEEIKDPLDSNSYLDANHIMNGYTICQMDTSDDRYNLQVTNVIRSR